jgi:hypothetical protein
VTCVRHVGSCAVIHCCTTLPDRPGTTSSSCARARPGCRHRHDPCHELRVRTGARREERCLVHPDSHQTGAVVSVRERQRPVTIGEKCPMVARCRARHRLRGSCPRGRRCQVAPAASSGATGTRTLTGTKTFCCSFGRGCLQVAAHRPAAGQVRLRQPGYGPPARRSTRVAGPSAGRSTSWPSVLACRKVPAQPEGDVNGLLIATVCSFAGRLLLTFWLQDQGRYVRTTTSRSALTSRRRRPCNDHL